MLDAQRSSFAYKSTTVSLSGTFGIRIGAQEPPGCYDNQRKGTEAESQASVPGRRWWNAWAKDWTESQESQGK